MTQGRMGCNPARGMEVAMSAKVEAAVSSPNSDRSVAGQERDFAEPLPGGVRGGSRFAIPRFEQAAEHLFWLERHSASLIPLKSALLLGAFGFFAFVILDRYARGITATESVGRCLIVAVLLGLFYHLQGHRRPLSRVGPIARLAAALSAIDLVATLVIDGNPRFYTEAWPGLLPIYFFTYGQMVMSVADSVIFGCSAMVAMPLAGYAIGTEPEGLASSVIILLIVNLFGLCTRCQLEIHARNSFRERRKAEIAAEDKSRFLRHIGHNLQQPLQALSCYSAALDAALAEMPVEAARHMVRKLESAIDDMNDAFRRILDLSSLEGGEQSPHIADVAVNPLLTALDIQFAPQACRKGLKFKVRLRSSPPFHLRTDATTLRQIIGNLVDNAIKYTDHGGVLVAAVKVSATHLSLHVTDTGRGIPDHHRERVFAEFNRGQWRQSDAAVAGWGIGLDYVRKALERLPQHGLRFRSRPGRGTDFQVLVPFVPVFLPHGGQPASPPRELDGVYVLLLDGREDARNAVADACRGWGCLVDHAGSLEQVRFLLPDMLRPPDLVIADLFESTLGHADSVMATVEAEFGAVPLLIHSEHTLSAQQRAALPSHALLLRKPASEGALLTAMMHAIRREVSSGH